MTRSHRRWGAVVGAFGVLVGARWLPACDICAVYTATEMGDRRLGPRIGVAEQLTVFNTLQNGSVEIDNRAGERIVSSTTQVWAGYRFLPRLGVQVNLPLIARAFRRLEGSRLIDDDEVGIGDLVLLGDLLAFSHVGERDVFRFSLLGGIKLPTGDSDRLAEELAEDPEASEIAVSAASRRRLAVAQHAGENGATEESSGVHGHDLALGSGSLDGIVGGQLFWSRDRFFLTAAGQYAIRTEGDFHYQFANDLTWTGGPGFFPLLHHAGTLGLQFVLSGETKGNDTQAGAKLNDTAVTALYAGPGISGTWGTALAAEIGLDLPLIQHNTGLQMVPDYRIRGGATWRF